MPRAALPTCTVRCCKAAPAMAVANAPGCTSLKLSKTAVSCWFELGRLAGNSQQLRDSKCSFDTDVQPFILVVEGGTCAVDPSQAAFCCFHRPRGADACVNLHLSTGRTLHRSLQRRHKQTACSHAVAPGTANGSGRRSTDTYVTRAVQATRRAFESGSSASTLTITREACERASSRHVMVIVTLSR